MLPLFIKRQLPLMRHRRVVVSGRNMHVMDRGEGRPVLMLHGNPTWSFLYRKVIAALLDDNRGQQLHLVAPDLIGLGFSEKPRDPLVHTLRNHSRYIASLVEALDLRDVILVVQDWGGPIGLHAFRHMQDRLSGLVVLNTVVGPPKPGFRPTAFHRFAHSKVLAPLAFRGLGFPQLNLNIAQGDKRSIPYVAQRAYRYPLRNRLDNGAPLALARMVPDDAHHVSIQPLQECQEVFDAFDGPCHVVWGDNDPVLGGVRTHIERLKPTAKVTRTNAGHFLQEEVPQTIADAILDVDAQL